MLKSINLKSAVVALALGGLIAASSSSNAGTEVKDAKASKNVVQQTSQSCITGDLGVNFVSEYISRGLVYENQGAIAQPYADLYFSLFKGEGAINAIQLQLGVWSSIQSHVNDTNVGYGTIPGSALSKLSGVRDWFEFDYTLAVATTFMKNYTATLSYIEADYPGLVAVDPNRNIQLGLAMNDSDYLGVFALHPHFNVLYELNTNQYGAAGINKAGWYYEIGLAPSYTALKDSKCPITLTLPLTVGLGDVNGFYGRGWFGYFTTGLNASVPVAFIPSCYGAWTVTTGFNYYRLGTDAANYSAGSVTGNRVQDQFVFSGGVGLTF